MPYLKFDIVSRPRLRFAAALLLAVFSVTPQASPLFENLRSGEFQTLNAHQAPGQWLVVMIWAHDCEVCEREVGDYQRFHQRGGGANAKVLGITLDGGEFAAQARDFISRHGLTFDNLIAEPQTVVGYYQAVTGSRWVGTPSFLVFGADGELKAKQVGAVEVEVVENFIAANSRQE